MNPILKKALEVAGFIKRPVSVHAIIPVRLESTRLPLKAVRPIAGKIMAAHVHDACRKAGINPWKIHVAVDHCSIADELAKHNVPTIMTAEGHVSGTSRILEACKKLKLPDDTIVLNIQGDEPEIDPKLIRQLATVAVDNPGCIATLKCPATMEDMGNPNVVKVLTRPNDMAIYFSRGPVPYPRDNITGTEAYRHVGVYAYSVGTLKAYMANPMSKLEAIESLEQLRAIENDIPIIAVDAIVDSPHGVDTLEDFNSAKQRMENKGK